MRRTGNRTKSHTIRVTVSEQVEDLLNQIADTGLMGHNRVEVAHRLIDQGVMQALDNPHLDLKLKTKPKK